MRGEIVLLLLFSIATAVALLARWIKVPYTVALVIAGLGLGSTHLIAPPHLTQELLYSIFLPGLVFEAAFHLDGREFWRNKLAIHALAVPGVAAAIGLTALLLLLAHVLHLAGGLSARHALVFAALIAATDPIAVVALFRSLGAPKRLTVLIEAESLLNDATAVVFYTLILGLFSGGSYSLASAALDFIWMIGMGIVSGLGVGFVTAKLARHADDPMIEIMLTTIAAYGSFVLGESCHASGIIATVAAGMLCAAYGTGLEPRPVTRAALTSFWEYVAFALNSIVFLLIGFEVTSAALFHSWPAILGAYLAVLGGRAFLVGLVVLLLRRTREVIPWSWSVVLTWGGLRGGLSMVLVLALPQGFPLRQELVTMTFGVVLLSLLVQGLSIGRLLRWLGLAGLQPERQRERADM